MYMVGFFIFTTWTASLSVVQNAIAKSLPLVENDETHMAAVKDYLDATNTNGLIYVRLPNI